LSVLSTSTSKWRRHGDELRVPAALEASFRAMKECLYSIKIRIKSIKRKCLC